MVLFVSKLLIVGQVCPKKAVFRASRPAVIASKIILLRKIWVSVIF
jgi:hypothetical protein